MAFESLTDRLAGVFKKLRGHGKLTEADIKAAMREVRMALLEADVNYKVAKDFCAKVSERAMGQEVMESLTPAQQVVKIVNEELVALMGGEEADLVITDPPYNVNYKDGSIKNDNMDEGSFEDFLQNAFLAMFENMRLGAAAYIFHADSEGLAFRRAFRDAGFKLAECLIWEKNSFVLGRQDYQWRHEPILYGWKEGAAHYFIDDRSQDTILLEDELDLESMKKEDLITYINQIIAQYKDQTTVLFEKKPTKNDVHPTMKPVNLVGRLMRNSSKPGWNVLDLFGGSGSTLMAAEQIGRRAFLMELDEKFCDVIVHRWEEFTGKKAVRAGKLEVSL